MKKTLLLLVLPFLFFSCNQSGVYDRFDSDFTENRWLKNDAKTYEFTIDDDTRLYDIVFTFSHVYGYQFDKVPLRFELTLPGGQTVQRAIDLPIKDAKGHDLGDCSGDYCDLDYVLENQKALKKGTYKITVSHAFEGPYLPNVLGIGLRVGESAGTEVLGVKVR